jgi:hypothetical protein
MKSFKELRTQLDEINFKADAKKLEISRTKISKTDVFYHAEKKGSKKIRVWVKPKSAKEPEELGVFKDMKTAEKSATQFVKLMGEDITAGLDVRRKIIEQTKLDDMLKEVNFLGEATLLGKRPLDTLARMTDMNRHNDSVKFLAQLLKRKPEEKIMDSIIEIHKIERSMHPALIKYRTDIMNRLLKMADRVFSNAKDIHAAF